MSQACRKQQVRLQTGETETPKGTYINKLLGFESRFREALFSLFLRNEEKDAGTITTAGLAKPSETRSRTLKKNNPLTAGKDQRPKHV